MSGIHEVWTELSACALKGEGILAIPKAVERPKRKHKVNLVVNSYYMYGLWSYVLWRHVVL
jgi:hypothetical protein